MSKGRANKRRLVPVKKAKKKINYKKAVIVSCAAFVGFVIILASVLGIYSAVRQRSYYMYYGGVGIDEGIVNFFSAAYKSTYLRELNKAEGVEHKDAEELWQSKMADGKTYGEDLKARTENYLKKLVAANAIVDSYAPLGSQDKDKINKAIEDKLGNYNFSVAEFNKAAAPYGFDYSDFKVATEMLYKQNYT